MTLPWPYIEKMATFMLKKRSKRCSRQESIVINSRNYNRKNKIYAFIEKIKAEHSLPDRINYDCTIVLTEGGPTSHDKGCGCLAFMTGHSPRGGVLQVGRGGDVARIYRIAYALNRLHSKWSQPGIKHKKRWRMTKAGVRISAKIRQIVQDLHEKLTKFLCTSFSVILLSCKYESSKKIRSGQRKL
jgi:hypothetical protein